jgi:hypothetical protein
VREAAAWSSLRLGRSFPGDVTFLAAHLKGELWDRKVVVDYLWPLDRILPEEVAPLTERCITYWYDFPEQCRAKIRGLYAADPATVQMVLLAALRPDEGNPYGDENTRSDAAEMAGFLSIQSPELEEGLLAAVTGEWGPLNSATWALGRVARAGADDRVVAALKDIVRRGLAPKPPEAEDEAEDPLKMWPNMWRQKSEPDDSTLEAAALALGRVGLDDPEVEGLLTTVLSRTATSKHEPEPQSAAAIALARRGRLSREVLVPLLDIWERYSEERPWSTMHLDAWEQADEALKGLAQNQARGLAASLLRLTHEGNLTALDAYLRLLPSEHDERSLKAVAGWLIKGIGADNQNATTPYFNRLQAVAARLTEITVADVHSKPACLSVSTSS